MRRLLLAGLLALAPLAGCISPQDLTPDAATPSHPATVAPPSDRIAGMTADATHEDKAVDCGGGTLQLPPGSCMERTLVVTGRIGLDALPVDLSADNGAITIAAGSGAGDAWGFTAVYRVRAATADDAKRGLDTAWSWSHTDGTKHFLKAGANVSVPLVGPEVVSSKYQLTLPPWVVASVRAETTNGAITISGLPTHEAKLRTTNGAIGVDGRAGSLDATTTNGAIRAAVTPAESGKIALRTTNGGVSLSVPESRDRAYDVDARTTNGRIQILLHDGERNDADKGHATFRTSGYDARAVQTSVAIETTNGGVTVGGA